MTELMTVVFALVTVPVFTFGLTVLSIAVAFGVPKAVR